MNKLLFGLFVTLHGFSALLFAAPDREDAFILDGVTWTISRASGTIVALAQNITFRERLGQEISLGRGRVLITNQNFFLACSSAAADALTSGNRLFIAVQENQFHFNSNMLLDDITINGNVLNGCGLMKK